MIDLLDRISKAGILLNVVEDKLKIFSELEFIDEDLLIEIKDNKEAIIDYLISNKQTSHSSLIKLEIPTVDMQDSYPISDAQRRLWVLSQFEQESIAYNMPSYLDLKGYDIDIFRRSISSVLLRHEVLR
ncbi:condensation domain-containing protein, partial [Aquimarina algiphila]|uniref:condensation domain-containing protein n=1 Tax=Aquimarina algiphila TaxID=2047982 RepID=UPI00232C06C7